ncbi:MAG: lipoprotein-releasing system permease protein [Candidatus Magnetoglobus multicellularis str. Araruama]|uniref:Lipoprotein-releasing system permease protein n=1 Tax=Candidatus Magnetoglobus multicellularis str. Araruama TaxID=890399 RepID=A0A1V1P609_9BACT|nr:MAG: lipoprotein-releasing system permease protein [Candidatus Magnetoglobus multicellularis str. Araruama]
MAFESYIGFRYLKARRKQRFVSASTLISIMGVIVGVMALIIVISVMAGFEDELKQRILSVASHVQVTQPVGRFTTHESVIQQLKSIHTIQSTFPFVQSQVILKSLATVSGASIFGLDFSNPNQRKDIEAMLVKGTIDDLFQQSIPKDDGSYQPPGLIIGQELAKSLTVRPGDSVYVISPRGILSPFGHLPAMRRFQVTGIMASGMYEFDIATVYMRIEDAQKVMRMPDSISGLSIKTSDIYHVGQVRQQIQNILGDGFRVQDWIQMNQNLFSALKLEKVTMFIILTLIILVAAFNIAGTLIMMVMERTRDIAILKAMGTQKRTIRRIFMVNGLFIGFTGTIIGSILGIATCLSLKKYKFIELPGDVYYVTTLPVQISATDISMIGFAAMFICFLATLYPAHQAAALNPVEAFRYE